MTSKSALAAFSDELAELVAGVERCTVTLEGNENDHQSSGSGFVLDGDGHVVTNEYAVHSYTSMMTATIGVESC